MKDWGLKKWFDRRFRKARKSLPPGPDLELIKIFACARDRDWPDIFVGRREEIGIVEESCRFALRNCRKGNATAGNIVIFSGAPGSGKISLLEHFSKAWQGKSDPLVVSAPCHFPENEARLAGKIGSRVVPEKADNDERGTVKPRQGGLSISSIGELDFLSSTGKSGIKPDFEKLAKWMPRERWDRPVCLVIDEIQNVTPESRNCLNLLHLGEHGLPIVLVGAGLADSVKKIESALAPRLSAINKRTLGALAPDEVQSCLQQMFDLCRIAYDSRELKSLAAGLTKRSEGWPQHMRTEAAALFTELDKTRGRLKAIDRAAVVRAARGFRRNSYLARQSDEMRDRADRSGGAGVENDAGRRRNQARDGAPNRRASEGNGTGTARFAAGYESRRFFGSFDSPGNFPARNDQHTQLPDSEFALLAHCPGRRGETKNFNDSFENSFREANGTPDVAANGGREIGGGTKVGPASEKGSRERTVNGWLRGSGRFRRQNWCGTARDGRRRRNRRA